MQKDFSEHQRTLYIVPLLALVILLVAFGLRAWNLEAESIWHDEAWSIRAIRAPFEQPDDRTPFGYYGLMHVLWRAGTGESPFAYRYGSALLGVLGAAMVMRLGGRWYEAGVGLAAGAMVAVSPLLWDYSQEVRAYIAVPLLATALLYGADRLLRGSPTLKTWALLFAVELAALYTHNLAVPLVAWLNLAVMGVWLARRDKRRLGMWVAVQVALVILYLPWLTSQTPSGTPLNTPPLIGLGLARDIWYSAFLPSPQQLREAGQMWPLDALGVALVVGTVVWGVKSVTQRFRATEQQRGWLLISHVVLVPILTTMLITAAHIDFHPRYYIASVPGMMVLVAVASYQLPAFSFQFPVSSFQKRKFAAQPIVISIVSLIVAAISLGSIRALSENRAYQHDDFAGLAAYYASLPDDTVILLPFGTEPTLQAYYAGEMNIRARFVNLPLYSDEGTAAATISGLIREGYRHIEFLTWYQLPADERGMYPCLLTAASSSVDEGHTFFGLMTQGYTLEGLAEMRPLQADLPSYTDYRLEAVAYNHASSGTCVRTSWRGSAVPGLSVVAALLSPVGETLARTDAEVAPANPASGELGEAYSLLNLPEAAPLTNYDLALTLYSPEQPSGYDVMDENGNPTGKVYVIDYAVPANGPPYVGEWFDAPRLQGDNAGDDRTVDAGKPLDITLLLNADNRALGRLTLSGNGWAEEQQVTFDDQPVLEWHRFIVPPGNAGEFVLRMNNVELARYTIVDVARAFEPPAYDLTVGAEYPGIGQLVGATVGYNAEYPLYVSLVWKAEDTPEIAYTVFVQLIGEDGSVIAQSDQMPAANTRPTTGWLAGEYIIDTHTLTVPKFVGTTRLIVGLYDAAAPGFPRARTDEGADYIELAVEIGG